MPDTKDKFAMTLYHASGCEGPICWEDDPQEMTNEEMHTEFDRREYIKRENRIARNIRKRKNRKDNRRLEKEILSSLKADKQIFSSLKAKLGNLILVKADVEK